MRLPDHPVPGSFAYRHLRSPTHTVYHVHIHLPPHIAIVAFYVVGLIVVALLGYCLVGSITALRTFITLPRVIALAGFFLPRFTFRSLLLVYFYLTRVCVQQFFGYSLPVLAVAGSQFTFVCYLVPGRFTLLITLVVALRSR